MPDGALTVQYEHVAVAAYDSSVTFEIRQYKSSITDFGTKVAVYSGTALAAAGEEPAAQARPPTAKSRSCYTTIDMRAK